VLLEAVAEDIREYLRSRRDTIRCIVTMLTDDSAGANPEAEGESLFEELKRTVGDEVHCLSNLISHVLCMLHKLTTSSHMPVLSQHQPCVSYSASLLSWKQNLGMLLMVDASGIRHLPSSTALAMQHVMLTCVTKHHQSYSTQKGCPLVASESVCVQGEDSDDEAETDEAALASAERWEPDPVDADPSRSARTRRMHDIISMLVGIYGSKELFITEYRCATTPATPTAASMMQPEAVSNTHCMSLCSRGRESVSRCRCVEQSAQHKMLGDRVSMAVPSPHVEAVSACRSLLGV